MPGPMTPKPSPLYKPRSRTKLPGAYAPAPKTAMAPVAKQYAARARRAYPKVMS